MRQELFVNGGGPQKLPSADAAAAPDATRTRLLQSAIALVEDLRSTGCAGNRTSDGYSPDFQVCLPYRGVFTWHVGGDAVVSDANQVLFVTGNESFHITQPLRGGYAELIITPSRRLLAELAREHGYRPLGSHVLFRRRSRRASPRVQLRGARLLHLAQRRAADDLEIEEAVIDLLRAAFDSVGSGLASIAAASRVTDRAKIFLEAHLTDPIRLGDVASAVGVSAAYLTDLFRRTEGVSLSRYLKQLRLARALVELPHANDLTALALGMGFSSHSHFTAAFRRTFGCTPSRFRGDMKTTSSSS
ncbi:MAG: helix-turn-helix transcriptional regulator [Acidobacteriota bacterium]